MPSANRNVDDGGRLGEFGTAVEHAADPEIFFTCKSQENSRPERFRRNVRACVLLQFRRNVKFLFCARAMLGRRRRTPGTALRNIWIGDGAAAAGFSAHASVFAATTTAAESATASERNAKHRRLIEINRDCSVISVHYRAMRILNSGVEN